MVYKWNVFENSQVLYLGAGPSDGTAYICREEPFDRAFSWYWYIHGVDAQLLAGGDADTRDAAIAAIERLIPRFFPDGKTPS